MKTSQRSFDRNILFQTVTDQPQTLRQNIFYTSISFNINYKHPTFYFLDNLQYCKLRRDWSPKFEIGLNIVYSLSFCLNDPPRITSFWQRNSLVTHIFFDLCLLYVIYVTFSPVAKFGDQPLITCKDTEGSNKSCLITAFEFYF